MAHATPSPAKAPEKRRNIYFRNPHLYEALQMAVEKGLIQATSASARLEELLETEIRRLAPKLRAARVAVPEGIFKK